MQRLPSMSSRCSLDCVGPLEPASSRWPARIYGLVLALVFAAILISGLPPWARWVAALVACWLALREWRAAPVLHRLTFSPQHLRVSLHDGRVCQAEAPFRCSVQRYWVAVRVPAWPGGWLHLYADQLPADRFRQFRRVLWLGKR